MKEGARRNVLGRDVEAEEAVGVVEADVGDEFGEGVEVVGEFAFFGFVADEVAEDAAEVFVAWEGEEGAGVC